METVRLSGWKSPEEKSACLAAYDSAMRLWPVPFESRQVATRFGSTHVGDRDPTTTGRMARRGRQTAINKTYY